MLKIKLKNNCVAADSTQPLRDYLISLGISPTNVDSILYGPRPGDELSPWLLDNMDKAITLLHEGFTQNKKFFIIVDCDVDGFTSASIFYRYFKLRYPAARLNWMLHEGKEHGIELDKVPNDCDYIIVPDAGSMNLEQQNVLLSQGKTVIILDHHEVTEFIHHDRLALVNNQSSELFANKAACGAGVTFKAIQAYEQSHPDMWVKANYFYDLAALGTIADMMDMRSTDNNAIVYKGLRNINNEMFKALIKQQEYKLQDGVNKMGVAFYIAPIINGVIRAGSMEDKQILFKGFIEEPDSEYVETTYRGTTRKETFYAYAARTAYNVKNRQDSEKKKCFAALCDRIDKEHLDDNQVIAVVASKDDKVPVPQNITGLIAMELLKKYNKPILVLRPKTENGKLSYAGSGRCKPFEGLSSFLQFVRDSEYSEYGEGHAMAFGASIPAEHYDDFIKESNERLSGVDFSVDYIEVDAIFNDKYVNTQMLMEFAKAKDVYGNAIPEPRIAMQAIVDSDRIMLQGEDRTTVKIMIGGIPCIKFKDKELAKQFSSGKRFKITLVGKPKLNVFGGRETVQLFIDDIEVNLMPTTNLF